MDFSVSPGSSSDSGPEVKRCGLTISQCYCILGRVTVFLVIGMVLSAVCWYILNSRETEVEYQDICRTAGIVFGFLLVPCILIFFCLQIIGYNGRSNSARTWARAQSIEMVSLPQTPTHVEVQQPQDSRLATISDDEQLQVQVHEPSILQEQHSDDVETASTYSTSSVETVRLQPDVPEPVVDPIMTRARARADEDSQRRRTQSERAEPVVTRSRVNVRGAVTPPRLPSEIVLLPGQLPEDPQAMGSGEIRRRRFIAAQFEKRKSPRTSKPDTRK